MTDIEKSNPLPASSVANPIDLASLAASVTLAIEQGNYSYAIQQIELALSQEPDNSALLKALVRIHIRTGNTRAALNIYRDLLAANPDHLYALQGVLGTSDNRTERGSAFTKLYEIARRTGASDSVWATLSRTPWGEGDWRRTADILEEGILRTDSPVLRLIRSMTFPKVPIDREEIEATRQQAVENLEILKNGYRIPDLLASVNRTQFHTVYHHHNGKELQRRFAEVHLALNPALAWSAPAALRRRTRARPRIGYFAGLSSSHIVVRSIHALIENSGHVEAEQLVIQPRDSVRDNESRPAPVIRVDGDLARARMAIAELDLDVLVYPEVGMDPFSYYLSFSRLARVQAAMPGQGLTTGVPNIDYFLTSVHWETGEIGHHYTETPVRLPVPPYFFLPESKTPNSGVRAKLGISEDAHVYLCNHSIYKYHPDFDEMIAGVLRKDPKALIVLLHTPDDAWWARLLKRWRTCFGDLIQRVKTVPRMGRADYLGLVQTTDIILDSPHHGSGITGYESLYMGTPLVTQRSPFMRGGMTAGLYEMLEVNDLIATNVDDYVALAVQTASDKDFRANISRRLVANRQKLVCGPESAQLFVKCLTEIT